ncbi:hypothetical protein LTS18_011397, partial [Coniosporium uncinatum]
MAHSQATPRSQSFNPVDTSKTAESAKDEVESPSVSSTTALCRFEFESGRGNEGTKILMVEWEDDPSTRDLEGNWHISWEGKTTVLPADGRTGSDTNRMYFLLPPSVPIPPNVTLTHRSSDSNRKPVVWHTNPLPAIFPPELGTSARTAGKKGVLHTIWAKKRLQALKKEIDEESQLNVESVGLIMAVQEKEWIEHNFGVTARPNAVSVPSDESA